MDKYGFSKYSYAVIMLPKILIKSFRSRKALFILPTIALFIGVSVGSALFMVNLEVEDQIAKELRAFGPNLIVVPESDEIDLNVGGINLGSISETGFISERDAMLIKDLPIEVFGGRVKGVLGKNAFLYSIVMVNGRSEVILAGTWFDQLEEVNLWWDLEGEYPEDNDSVVIGKDVSESMKLDIGDRIDISYSDSMIAVGVRSNISRSREFIISGIVTTGSEDDSRIFGDLDAVQNLTNKENKVNIMHISAICNECPLEDIADIIEDNIAGVEVKTVKQVAMAEMNTLEMVTELVGLITIVALGASGLAVFTTMMLSVVERRREIGLMKAVGAPNFKIATMFLGEGMIIATLSGISGFALGAVISRMIGIWVFESSFSIHYSVIFFSVSIAIAIVIISSIVPIRMAMKVDPAVVLRGE
jgi:putative ABC transport system permease protein